MPCLFDRDIYKRPFSRVLTGAAFEHLGLAAPPRDPAQIGLFANGDGA